MCLVTFSCSDHDTAEKLSPNYFAFGTFCSMCEGDRFHTWIVTDNAIYKNKINVRLTVENGDWDLRAFDRLPTAKKMLGDQLRELLPKSLIEMNDNENFIGCPDCHDQGGVYIQLNQDGHKRSWYIDNLTNDPEIKSYFQILRYNFSLLRN